MHRTEIDGIPTFHADAPGAFTGALLFRVGRSDESLRTGGMSHLVEHLALHPFERLPHGIGGFVDDTRTVFHASGTPAEVAAFLTGICRNLTELPAERVVTERRVLRAESDSTGSPHPLWALRFGPRGYGLLGYNEFGLHWLEADDLQQWSDERFCRANAVMWFSGEPPEGLSIDLPSGQRFAPPPPETVSDLRLPAWANAAGAGVALSLLPERTSVMSAGTHLFTERLQEYLRRDLGLTYSAGSSYWRLDSSKAHVIIGTDAAPGHNPQVRDGFLQVLEEFSGPGPAPDQVEHMQAMYERYADEDERLPGVLDTYASDELAGHPTPDPEDLAAEYRAMTPADVAAEFALAIEEMIIQVPPGLGLPSGRAKPYRAGPEVAAVAGTDYGGEGDQIIIGEEGVTRGSPNSRVTVRFEDCELAALEANYSVSMIDRWGNGLWFRYKGDGFREEIPAKIRAGLPAERVLQVDREVLQRAGALRTVADAKLGDHKGWAVAALPYVVFDDEQVLEMARGKWRDEDGLLVLTDLRLLFVDAEGERLSVELGREQIERVDAGRSLLKSELTVHAAEGADYSFSSLGRGDAREMAAAISGDQPGARSR